MYLPAFFLSSDIAQPLTLRSLNSLKFFWFIPPKAIIFFDKFRVNKLNLVVPKNPFLNLLDVLKILDKRIYSQPWLSF